jgi:hypothetical protein
MADITWNPSDKSSQLLLSSGNLVAGTNTVSGVFPSVRATNGKSGGKWYWEVTLNAGTVFDIGVETSAGDVDQRVGYNLTGYGWRSNDGKFYNNNTIIATGNTFTTSDVIGIAVDFDAGKMWFSKGGVWELSGDPAAGTDPNFTGVIGTFFPAITVVNPSSSSTVNFGASAFSYSMPAGFAAYSSYFSISTTIPAFRAILTGHDDRVHISAAASIPAFTASGTATVSGISPKPDTILSSSLPAVVGRLYGGGIAEYNINAISFTSISYGSVSGSLTLPIAVSLLLAGTVGISGSMSPTLSKFSFASNGLIAILGNFSKTLTFSSALTGLVGVSGSMALTLSRSSIAIVSAIIPHGDGTFSIVFSFNAEGNIATYRALVLNLKNYGVTEYLNYKFNSLCSFNGKNFGANSTGIYELTGTQDVTTDISWQIVTPRFDLETDNVKKLLRHAWLGYKPSGDLMLTAILPDGNEYEYLAESVDVVDNGLRVKFGKGIKTRYVEFELTNIANESVVLDKFRIFVEPIPKVR